MFVTIELKTLIIFSLSSNNIILFDEFIIHL
jgi:hypothetical protein